MIMSMCVCVHAASYSAYVEVSDLTQNSAGDYIVTVKAYFTGSWIGIGVNPVVGDNFEYVSGTTTYAMGEVDDANGGGFAAMAGFSPITSTDLHLVTYTYKAVSNGTSEIGVTVKMMPDKNTSGYIDVPVTLKSVTVDCFTCTHDWQEVAAAKYLKSAADCTNAAEYYKSCSKCKVASTTETFTSGDAKGHTPTQKVDSKYLKSAATCSGAAVYYESCSVCKTALTTTFEYGTADASKHVWENKSDDSKHWQECTCGAKQNEEAHSYTTKKYDTTNHWDECSCGKQTNVTAHTIGTDYTSDSTQHWHACSDCDYKADVANHVCETCSDDNYHWEECKDCEYVNESTKVAHTYATEHNETNHWKQCSVCDHKKDSTEEAHSQGELKSNSAEHWYVCSGCDYEYTHEAHNDDNQAADCTHKAICSCGVEHGSYVHTNPTYKHVEAKEATIEEDGNIEYYECECGQRFIMVSNGDSGELVAVDDEYTVVKYNLCDANGHDMAIIDCGDDDYHMMLCTNDCGTIFMLPHSYGLDGKCAACGHTTEINLVEEEIVIETPVESETEEVDEDVKVADEEPESNPVTGVAFSMAALATAAATMFLGKKR